MRLAVTGAAGLLGASFVAAAHDAEIAVRGQFRPGTAADRIPAQLTDRVVGTFAGAATPVALWDDLLSGCDACIHCAFHHEPGRYRHGEGNDPAGFWEQNLMTTLGLLEACLKHGVERVVLLSSRAVFDGWATGRATTQSVTGASSKQNAPPLFLDDDAAPRPTTHYGALKATEEALVQRYAAETDLCTTALRTTGVYGVAEPIQRSKWLPIFSALVRGESPPPCLGTEVHGADLGAAALCLLQAPNEDVRGRIFNCSDILISHRDLTLAFNRQTGLDRAVPLEGPEPGVQLRCPGLRELGWQPAGRARLAPTLSALIHAATEGLDAR
ncbi:MAG: NAD(P)-dependent oxidoreductase [Pseudomonadota bacterium]